MASATFLLLLSALMPTPASDEGRRAPEGRWGGTGISIQVDSAGAKIELDCASGAVSGSLLLDADGRFDVAGTYERGSMGPVREGAAPKVEPARYRGRLEGESLTLEILLGRGGKAIGPFTARRGAPARIRSCL
ncbi:MAG: hypothetical protein WEB59_08870 [Thermoanaerobaculia bacterium]